MQTSVGSTSAAAAMQGWRDGMEDYHVRNEYEGVYAVFDGHGGKGVAETCAQTLLGSRIEPSFDAGSLFLGMDEAAMKALEEAHARRLQGEKRKKAKTEEEDDPSDFLNRLDSGSRATLERDRAERLKGKKKINFFEAANHVGAVGIVVWVTADKIVVANAGDCRAILARGGKVIQLNTEHSAYKESEKKRIEAAGLTVRDGRLAGDLQPSRGFGDFMYKNPKLKPEDQAFTAVPEVTTFERTADDEFIVIGSDGLWDMISNEVCAQYVRELLVAKVSLLDITRLLTCRSVAPYPMHFEGGSDNVTCIIVSLRTV